LTAPSPSGLSDGDSSGPSGISDRDYWAGLLQKIAAPVLSNMSQGKLRRNMPVEYSPIWDGRNSTGTKTREIVDDCPGSSDMGEKEDKKVAECFCWQCCRYSGDLI